MTQFEFYKSFLFVTELLLAESMFLYRYRRRSLFWLRLPAGIAACYLFAWLFPILSHDAFYCAFTFLMIFSFTILVGKVLFRESWLTVVFCCFAGYTTQHLAYESYTLLLTLMNANSTGFYGTDIFLQIFPNLFIFALYMFLHVTIYFLCFVFFSTKLQEEIEVNKSFIFIFSILILIVDILLNAVVVYYPSSEDAKRYITIISLYNILCCIVSLYLQFEVVTRRKIELTFDAMQQIWDKTKSQYEFSKESIEMINMKCHDIKHQIRELGASGTVNPDTLQELEDAVSIYDSLVKTGNEALDVILTEKSLLCNKQHIEFSCIADGSKLDFMREEDIYALFGNIIDNAIEAVEKAAPDRRVIDLQIMSTGEVVHIRESNYYEGEIVMENGLPRTSKGDRFNHGFGMRSIRTITERYRGTLNIEIQENLFNLYIVLFP